MTLPSTCRELHEPTRARYEFGIGAKKCLPLTRAERAAKAMEDIDPAEYGPLESTSQSWYTQSWAQTSDTLAHMPSMSSSPSAVRGMLPPCFSITVLAPSSLHGPPSVGEFEGVKRDKDTVTYSRLARE